MQIVLKWSKPTKLVNGSEQNLTYVVQKLEKLPSGPGVYIFARKFGSSYEALYVGRAGNLRERINQQFNNNRLMNGIKSAQIGARVVFCGKLVLKPGQKASCVLDILEPALINHALSEGHSILNKVGTKTPLHAIHSKGNTASRKIAPLTLYARAKP